MTFNNLSENGDKAPAGYPALPPVVPALPPVVFGKIPFTSLRDPLQNF